MLIQVFGDNNSCRRLLFTKYNDKLQIKSINDLPYAPTRQICYVKLFY